MISIVLIEIKLVSHDLLLGLVEDLDAQRRIPEPLVFEDVFKLDPLLVVIFEQL